LTFFSVLSIALYLPLTSVQVAEEVLIVCALTDEEGIAQTPSDYSRSVSGQ